MPYIAYEDRVKFDRPLAEINPDTAGELNYCFTRLIVNFMKKNGMRYQSMNDIVGALEGAKAEFQRQVVNPYENDKIMENGPVYAALHIYNRKQHGDAYALTDNGAHDETKD
jgi:hypothetical protein